MYNLRSHLPFSLVSLCYGVVGVLAVVYIGLIAIVMSYAALTVEFSQSAKNKEAAVAALEAKYLASVTRVTMTDYRAEGYAKPARWIFVPARSVTALR